MNKQLNYVYYLGPDYYPGFDYKSYFNGLSLKEKFLKYIGYVDIFIMYVALFWDYLKERILFKYNAPYYIYYYVFLILRIISENTIPFVSKSIDKEDKQKFAGHNISQYMHKSYNQKEYGYIMANIMFISMVRIVKTYHISKVSNVLDRILIKNHQINLKKAIKEKRLLKLDNFLNSREIIIFVSNLNEFIFLGILDQNKFGESHFHEFSSHNLNPKFDHLFNQTINDIVRILPLYHTMIHNLCELTVGSVYRNFTPDHFIYQLISPFEGNVFGVQDTSRNVFYYNDNGYHAVYGDIDVKTIFSKLKRNLNVINDPELLMLDYEYPFFDDYKTYYRAYKRMIGKLEINPNDPSVKQWKKELVKDCKIDLGISALDEILAQILAIHTIIHTSDTHTEGALSYLTDYKNFDSLVSGNTTQYILLSFFLNGLHLPRSTNFAIKKYNTLNDLVNYPLLRELEQDINIIRDLINKRNETAPIKMISTLPDNTYMGVLF
jgi:hypothetical protein